MPWNPIHDAHAIDRVRILVLFEDPLPTKLLARVTESVVNKHADLGFAQIKRVKSAVKSVEVQKGFAPIDNTERNGWVLQRLSGDALVEEAGFRDNVFGYFSLEYGRWENLITRFKDIFEAPLTEVFVNAGMATIKMEYWDKFVFEGDRNAADANEILMSIDRSIPAFATSGEQLWHSNIGWFETYEESPVLLNRNIQTVDEANADSDDLNVEDGLHRIMDIYTLTELREAEKFSESDRFFEALEFLHKRSLTLFGESINEQMRERIGLDLESYKL